MDFADIVPVFCEGLTCLIITGPAGERWVGDVEGVLQVAGGVLLRDEESVKVPEARFNKAMGRR